MTTNYIAELEEGQQVLARSISDGQDDPHKPGTPLHLVWDTKDGLLHIT